MLWEVHEIWKKISHFFWRLLSNVKTSGILLKNLSEKIFKNKNLWNEIYDTICVKNGC